MAEAVGKSGGEVPLIESTPADTRAHDAFRGVWLGGQVEQVLGSVPAGIAFFDLDDQELHIYYANDHLYDIFGVLFGDEEELRVCAAALTHETPDLLPALLELAPGYQKTPWTRVLHTTRCDGSGFWVQMVVMAQPRTAAGLPSYSCMMMDVTNQVLTEKAFNRQRDLYRLVMEDIEEIIFEYDIAPDTMHLYNAHGLSRGVFEVTTDYVTYVRSGNMVAEGYVESYLEMLHPQRSFVGTSIFDFNANLIGDEFRWWRSVYKVIAGDDGEPKRVIGLVREVTEEQRLKKQLREEHELARNLEAQASIDSATGLLNRRVLKIRIEGSLLEHQRAAFLMLDLDDFKGVNDQLGHQMGDAVLLQLGKALKEICRDTDIVGRLGGDEFVVFLSGVNQYSAAAGKAEAIIDAMQKICEELGLERSLGISVGIAMAPADGLDFQSLYASADDALYLAKAQGKDRFVFA